MRKFALGCLLFLAGIVCLAQQEQAGAFWQTRDSNYNVAISGGGGGGFQGPGDIASGAVFYGSCTVAYTAAYASGGGNACQLIDTATHTTTYTMTFLSTGFANFAGAAASSACATACSVNIIYDESGNAHNATASASSNVNFTFNALGTCGVAAFTGGSFFSEAASANLTPQP